MTATANPRTARLAGAVCAAQALAASADIWEHRLTSEWEPPCRRFAQVGPTTDFPFAMTRVSLAALLPGMRDAAQWLSRVGAPSPAAPREVALILAGNTPLMSWSPLAACLLAGHRVTAKMSRHETLWPRLFRDTLAEVEPGVANRIDLVSWPAEDARTAALIASADAVIAFGSDSTIATLRAGTPASTPFFAFGHSNSVGILSEDAEVAEIRRYASDILMYNQSGCLSPQYLLCPAKCDPDLYGEELSDALSVEAVATPPVSDPARARAVRIARDLALFEGCHVRPRQDSAELRWTTVWNYAPGVRPEPTGHNVIHLLPIENLQADWSGIAGQPTGTIACVGVAGTLTPSDAAFLRAQGVSRICAAGEMQAPPLDWPNGNVDLLEQLLRL